MVAISASQRRRNIIKLLILWLVPVGLMLIAGIYYYLAQTGAIMLGSTNHGILIRPPIQLKDKFSSVASLAVDENGQSMWDKKWSIVLLGDRDCDPTCRDALYLSRQVHIRLDKQAHRVQRLYLFDRVDGETVSNDLHRFFEQEHRLIKPIAVSKQVITTIKSFLNKAEDESARFFLVDPEGWAMMYYLPSHEGSDVLKDLKHLLKYSRER